ncbi:nitrate reductase [NADPH] [Rhodocollybia butyracea]|uniref:Nitrate reductase n=1 Tax=Rhodocollybia butyracea TaxID=206335 RepID=A0A9P5PGQ8_9AGAR|nr:nitrate reductase [NADPH] [Rhodocollybia butyracea]
MVPKKSSKLGVAFPKISTATRVSQDVDIPLPPSPRGLNEVLSLDKDTPDNHVPRDPRLIRLTGVHPFNVEAPLTDLFNDGFLTSSELFYVRNHGPVPQVLDYEIPTWELSIEGLVEHPIVLSFEQILQQFDQITAPVTLVCAGNRRKEQNEVRKSKGFSWGAAGVSTSLFTGPMMADIIRQAKPLRKARYVCMEGADKLPNGHYGTSVKLNWVMDPNRGIMLAHKMNGEPLHPDHGRPLRAVIPGQIGGRSVKWLKKLIVTEFPSDNWYHINDNRVLPTMVTPELASKDPTWWHDERYAIYDLSVNSAAVYPQHNEELRITSPAAKYTARGYAYGGGGRRITRVEVSLDNGKSWRLANIEYPEDKYRNFDGQLYGGRVDIYWRETCFCWCQWSLDISVLDLEASDAILVRAMDEAMNIQPRDMYWSVLGMMNNPWFRITITKNNGVLRFEHPTQLSLISGGWMDRVKKEGGDLTNGYWGRRSSGEAPSEPAIVEEIDMRAKGLCNSIDIEGLRKHGNPESPWFVVNGEVYDGTRFLEGHPGGAQSIISAAATDVSGEFLAIHSETAKAMMSDYHIGTLDEASLAILNKEPHQELRSEPREIFLEPRSWAKAKLSEKSTVSNDTRIFSFALDHEQQTFGLPTGQHIMLKVHDSSANKDSIIRAYTPVSQTYRKGSVDLLVKIYYSTPSIAGGKMTMALDQLAIGSSVEFKGPIGKFEYLGRGNVSINDKKRSVRSFRMICGGSGITPIFQVLRAVIQDSSDPTTCVVLDGNRTEEDILCKDELDTFAATASSKCSIIHTLTNGSSSWSGQRGRISQRLLKEYVSPVESCMVLICGRKAMEQSAHKILLQLGWDESDLVFF